MATSNILPQPLPGVRVCEPKRLPQPNEVLIGYEAVQPQVAICSCETLSFTGWISVLILAFAFLPLCILPCLIDSCHETIQRPVYGIPAPGFYPPGVPRPEQHVAIPVAHLVTAEANPEKQDVQKPAAEKEGVEV